MKLSEATKLVTILAAYFPNRDVPKETFQLWATKLEPFDARDGMAAVQELATYSRFIPSLAELIVEIDEQRKRRVSKQLGLPEAEVAWDFEGWVTAQEQMPWRKLIDETFPEATA